MKWVVGVVAVAFAIYAWWAAGVSPFSELSYALVGIPSVIVVFAYSSMGGLSPNRPAIDEYYQDRADGASPSTVAPWLILLLAVTILESVGLALGGRASSVPTLSTTIDYLLVTRWERCLLYVIWLLVGGIPLLRLWQLRHCRES